jgi:glycosyltransferase involved in cell wall biosynthesis
VAVWRAARSQIRTFRPDVVLSNAIEVPVLDRPTACIVHDLNFGGRKRGAGTAGRRFFYRWRARRLARVVTVSEAMRQLLVAAGMPADRTLAIRNGVDLERFRPAPGPARPDGRLALCYPARILPGKGQHVAVDAVARLPRSVRDRLVLSIVGTAEDPAYLGRLRRLARGLPVEFHLDVPDVVTWYQQADVVIFPTLMREGFGFTAVEALACGRPVIASDQDAIREATGGLAIPVPQGDAAALAVAIETLSLDPDLRERLGREGRDWVVGHASWDAAWNAYEEMLGRIAAEAGR